MRMPPSNARFDKLDVNAGGARASKAWGSPSFAAFAETQSARAQRPYPIKNQDHSGQEVGAVVVIAQLPGAAAREGKVFRFQPGPRRVRRAGIKPVAFGVSGCAFLPRYRRFLQILESVRADG
jgi:hypothetical protein